MSRLEAAWSRLIHSSGEKLLIAIIISSANEPHDSSQELLGMFWWKALNWVRFAGAHAQL
jgi:hypothetical protein